MTKCDKARKVTSKLSNCDQRIRRHQCYLSTDKGTVGVSKR